MDGERWGFEEIDDSEYEQLNSKPAPNPVDEPTETLVGQDSDGVVAVLVSPEGQVVRVQLSPEWRRSVEPWDLSGHVRSAVNAATMRALARNVERFGSMTVAAPAGPKIDAHESPLTSLDVQRL